jgi:hypothetical protein
VGAAVGSRVGKDSVETVNEDSFEGEALGFRTKQITHAHDDGDMALEAPTQFAGRRGDPAQLCNDNFLVVAQSLERVSQRLIVGFQVKVAEGKRHADAVRRGEAQNFGAGHGPRPRARRASASCWANHSA